LPKDKPGQIAGLVATTGLQLSIRPDGRRMINYPTIAARRAWFDLFTKLQNLA
jgi:hypothetical protein